MPWSILRNIRITLPKKRFPIWGVMVKRLKNAVTGECSKICCAIVLPSVRMPSSSIPLLSTSNPCLTNMSMVLVMTRWKFSLGQFSRKKPGILLPPPLPLGKILNVCWSTKAQGSITKIVIQGQGVCPPVPLALRWSALIRSLVHKTRVLNLQKALLKG